jgi:hypothetical protein
MSKLLVTALPARFPGAFVVGKQRRSLKVGIDLRPTSTPSGSGAR